MNITTLPVELICEVVQYMDVKYLLPWARCNKHMHALFEQSIWPWYLQHQQMILVQSKIAFSQQQHVQIAAFPEKLFVQCSAAYNNSVCSMALFGVSGSGKTTMCYNSLHTAPSKTDTTAMTSLQINYQMPCTLEFFDTTDECHLSSKQIQRRENWLHAYCKLLIFVASGAKSTQEIVQDIEQSRQCASKYVSCHAQVIVITRGDLMRANRKNELQQNLARTFHLPVQIVNATSKRLMQPVWQQMTITVLYSKSVQMLQQNEALLWKYFHRKLPTVPVVRNRVCTIL